MNFVVDITLRVNFKFLVFWSGEGFSLLHVFDELLILRLGLLDDLGLRFLILLPVFVVRAIVSIEIAIELVGFHFSVHY